MIVSQLSRTMVRWERCKSINNGTQLEAYLGQLINIRLSSIWRPQTTNYIFNRQYSSHSLSSKCTRPQLLSRNGLKGSIQFESHRIQGQATTRAYTLGLKNGVRPAILKRSGSKFRQRCAYSTENETEQSVVQKWIASIRNLTFKDVLTGMRRFFSLATLRSIFRLEMKSTAHPTFWGRVRWQALLQLKVLIVIFAIGYSIKFLTIGVFHLYQEFNNPTAEILTWNSRCHVHYLKFYEDKNTPLAGRYGLEMMKVLDADTKKQGGWEYQSFEYKRAIAATWIFIARLQQRTGFDQNALDIYQRALDTEHGVVDGPERANVLVRMADSYTLLKKYDEAFDCLFRAVEISATACKVTLNPKNPVFPEVKRRGEIIRPSPQLLDTITAVAEQYAKTPPQQPAKSLPIFLSLLRVLQALPLEERDLCREAWVMSFLGEVIFALGKRVDGYGWTMKGLEISEAGAIELANCKDCANYAVRNAITMKRELGIKSVDDEREIGDLRKRQNKLLKYDESRI